LTLNRTVLTDEIWSKIAPLCSGKKTDPGQTGGDARVFLEGVLWIARTGAPWRDLPIEYGNWNSVFKRFRRWVENGTFDNIFKSLAEYDSDLEYVMIDGSIVKVHRHGMGAKGGLKIRRSANREAA
jgi:transposase